MGTETLRLLPDYGPARRQLLGSPSISWPELRLISPAVARTSDLQRQLQITRSLTEITATTKTTRYPFMWPPSSLWITRIAECNNIIQVIRVLFRGNSECVWKYENRRRPQEDRGQEVEECVIEYCRRRPVPFVDDDHHHQHSRSLAWQCVQSAIAFILPCSLILIGLLPAAAAPLSAAVQGRPRDIPPCFGCCTTPTTTLTYYPIKYCECAGDRWSWYGEFYVGAI